MEKCEPQLRSKFYRIAAASLVYMTALTSCGSGEALPTLTSASTTTEAPTTGAEAVAVDAAEVATPVQDLSKAATASASANRLHPPQQYECDDPVDPARFVIFGNSVDSMYGIVNRTDRWQAGLQDNLNFSPYINGVKMVDKAVPGSGIMSPTIYHAPPMTEYVNVFLKTYKESAPKNTTVIIHPSYIEMTYFPKGSSAEDVGNRATMGVMAVMNTLKKYGYAVIVLPATPVTANANLKFMADDPAHNDVNAAIKVLNENLFKLGVTPKEMRYSALADANHKDANPKYYYDVAVNSLAPYYTQIPGGDGLHPGPSGQHVLANEIAKLDTINAAIIKTCKVRK